VAAQSAARAALTAVEAGSLSVRDKEMMATPVAAQEVAGVAPIAVEAGSPPKQNEKTMAAITAAHGGGQSLPNSGGGWCAHCTR
jgi:hypothetical protein